MNAKEKIVEFLSKKKIEPVATTRIAGTFGLHYTHALKLLQELQEEGKIETVKIGSYTGWKIKNKENRR